MKRRWVVAVGAPLLLAGVYLYLRQSPSLGRNVVIGTLESRVLGEPRQMIVHLPEGYGRDLERRYPVVYVLDGSSQDGHTARTAARLARSGVIPEMLVVGIPNTRGSRERDYTPPFLRRDAERPESPLGAGDRFLAFLVDELMPKVEREYRTLPFRVLAGHSRGGLLVVYSLIADPGRFDARFAFSAPWWRQDEITVARLRDALSSPSDRKTFLYLSAGDQETERMIRGHRSAVDALRQAPPWLRWQAHLTAGADHASNAELSTPAALGALYGPAVPPP
jgi:predicted alpha/beta superfamily hydrolase